MEAGWDGLTGVFALFSLLPYAAEALIDWVKQRRTAPFSGASRTRVAPSGPSESSGRQTVSCPTRLSRPVEWLRGFSRRNAALRR